MGLVGGQHCKNQKVSITDGFKFSWRDYLIKFSHHNLANRFGWCRLEPSGLSFNFSLIGGVDFE